MRTKITNWEGNDRKFASKLLNLTNQDKESAIKIIREIIIPTQGSEFDIDFWECVEKEITQKLKDLGYNTESVVECEEGNLYFVSSKEEEMVLYKDYDSEVKMILE